MTILFVKHVLIYVLLSVNGHSTCTFARAEPASVVKNEDPGGLKTTDADVDKAVTNVQLYSESSHFNSRWSTTTVYLPQTSYHDLELEGIVTTAYVEELLNRNETKEFLNKIENDVQREVITEQLRQCPYSELCTFSFNLSLPKRNVSACANCSCTNNNSSKFEMCPDILDFNSFGVIRSEPFDCFSMYLKPLKDGRKYKAIYKCPVEESGTDSCVSIKEGKTFTDILPVTDRTTNTTYINAQCAVCNKINGNNLEFWDIEMACEEREIHVYRTESELINFYEEKTSCNMKYLFEESKGAKPELCPAVIRKCNESGHWKTFDSFIASACAFYENRYSIEAEVDTPRYIYR